MSTWRVVRIGRHLGKVSMIKRALHGQLVLCHTGLLRMELLLHALRGMWNEWCEASTLKLLRSKRLAYWLLVKWCCLYGLHSSGILDHGSGVLDYGPGVLGVSEVRHALVVW